MRYYMLNKPKGLVTACSDPYKRTVMECFPENEREGLFPIGRLDRDTEGFLIMTDDGMLCHNINSPLSVKEKTYIFWAMGELSDESIRALEDGVIISDGGERLTAPARVERLECATMRDIAELFGEEEPRLRLTRRGDIKVTKVRITITEGKKHQVKKMAKAVGMKVLYLERISICGVPLDASLPRGAYRALTAEELEILKK